MRNWSKRQWFWIVGILAVVSLIVGLLAWPSQRGATRQGDTSKCRPLFVATSPEKQELLERLARNFEKSSVAKKDFGCVKVSVDAVASGEGAQLLRRDWPTADTTLPRPTLWSPASSNWLTVANDRNDTREIAPTDSPSLARSPLVLAMPRIMAQALGWPGKTLGYHDLHSLALNPQGWGAYGHPEWGAFRLGKTNPNFSTSGLNSVIAQYHAAAHKQTGLTLTDIEAARRFMEELESSVDHYGPTTMTFLNNWSQRDEDSQALGYVSVVAIEEKSVIDYNLGNPDGINQPGEKKRTPNDPLVAIYPADGTLESNNPLVTLNAPWVTKTDKAVAATFTKFVRSPEQQKLVMEYGFRPSDRKAKLGGTLSMANGINTAEPQLLPSPSAQVIKAALAQWGQVRKPSRVMLLFDVSGSMKEPIRGSDKSKLKAAVEGAKASLSHFRSSDMIGLRLFTTPDPRRPNDFANGYLDKRPVSPLGNDLGTLQGMLESIRPLRDTPLYDVVGVSYQQMLSQAVAGSINAIVLLSDGSNDNPRSRTTLDNLLRTLDNRSESSQSTPVRIFPIRYGEDAAGKELDDIAAATGGQVFDAHDPRRVDRAFADAMSNF